MSERDRLLEVDQFLHEVQLRLSVCRTVVKYVCEEVVGRGVNDIIHPLAGVREILQELEEEGIQGPIHKILTASGNGARPNGGGE